MGWTVAVIVGTGIWEAFASQKSRAAHIPTRWGLVRAVSTPEGLIALPRHGSAHRVPPHRVNYRANAAALASVGVRFCLATAATGSLRPDWLPGTIVVPSDFIDLSGRPTWQTEEVTHCDFSAPFNPAAREALLKAAGDAGKPVVDGGTYVCVGGPRYETPAEVAFLRKVGGDLVGMTAGSEAAAMRHVGVGYGLLSVVTNLATRAEAGPLSHAEVEATMGAVRGRVQEILTKAALHLARA